MDGVEGLDSSYSVNESDSRAGLKEPSGQTKKLWMIMSLGSGSEAMDDEGRGSWVELRNPAIDRSTGGSERRGSGEVR